MDSRFIPRGPRGQIKPVEDPRFPAASRQTLDVMGVILMHVSMGDLRVRTWFGVAQDLAVEV